MARIRMLSRYAGLLLGVCLGVVVPTYGQAHAVDVRDCYSPLLVTQESHTTETNWEYFYLSLIDEKTFDQIKAGAKTSALTPYGYFTGDFDYFQEKRRSYFELHNENIKFYQAMASNVSFLPESWRPTIDKCIEDTLRNSSNGLAYLVVNSTPKRFRLEIKYTSTEKISVGPYVRSSEITGGYVEADGKQRKSLYAACSNAKDSSCPDVNSRNEFTVMRDDPNEVVSITLNLSNEKHSTSFDVPIVPKKINCVSTYEGSKRQTITLPAVPARLTEYTYGSGGWESTIWTARAIAPGKITAMTNLTYNDATNMHLLDWGNPDMARSIAKVAKLVHQMDVNSNPFFQDDVILIVGTQNGGPPTKTVAITVEYHLPISTCKEEDWK